MVLTGFDTMASVFKHNRMDPPLNDTAIVIMLHDIHLGIIS